MFIALLYSVFQMPKKLRAWRAFNDLSTKISDFQTVLPLLQELSKPSLRPRHWDEVEKITGHKLPVTDAAFTLSDLLKAPLVENKDGVEEVCESADKQLNIEIKLKEIGDRWDTQRFIFSEWKGRGIPVLQGVLVVVEELEESQMNLQV